MSIFSRLKVLLKKFRRARIVEPKRLLVKDVMVRDVKFVSKDSSVREALGLFVKYRISALPVLDEGKIVGILSESDVLDFVMKDGKFDVSDLERLETTKVSKLMTKKVLTIDSSLPLEEAMKAMIRKKVNRLPVVDSDGRLVGIVSKWDLLRGLNELFIVKSLSEGKDGLVMKGSVEELLDLLDAGYAVETISKKLGITKKELEKWMKVLKKYGLVSGKSK